MKILNLGCGNDMYGTHRVDFIPTDATTEVCDLNGKLPYKDNFFDEIYCKSVLEHLKNFGTFTDECYRVLKVGGILKLRTDYAGCFLIHTFKRHEHNKAYKGSCVEDRHYALFVASHLRYLFDKFKNHKFNYFYGGSNWLKILLYKMLPNHYGACHIEMRAEK